MTRGATLTSIARPGSTEPMTSSPMARMGRKVAPERRRTLSAGRADRAGESGFTLIEIICGIAIVAMIAAIVLPAIPRGAWRSRLEAFAVDTAAVLKADRNAAIRRRTQIATEID